MAARRQDRRTPGSRPVRAKDALGRYGEDLAAQHLVAAGMVLLDRNWRCREGELDLVARDRDGTLVFCEVKTRSSDAFGAPMEAVTRSKQLRLRRLAAAWLDEASDRPDDIRFDVASVLAGQVEIIEGAF